MATLFPPELVAVYHGQLPPPALDGPAPDCETAHTLEKGHGRLETRRLTVSREVVPVLGWPGAAQVCRIERTREIKGVVSCEIVYAITSLPRERADAQRLLDLARAHWGIENRLHWRRDAVLREDASPIRTGAAPQAMAILRNTLLALTRHNNAPLTAQRQAFAENRCGAIATVKNGFL